MLRDLGPFAAKLGVQKLNLLFFPNGERVLAKARIEVVVPSLTRLFARTRPESGSDDHPSLLAYLFDQLYQVRVLFRSPGTLGDKLQIPLWQAVPRGAQRQFGRDLLSFGNWG